MPSMPSNIAWGGAAPATNGDTLWVMPARSFGSALMSKLCTIGAPQSWVTRCSLINSKISAGSTLRRHTFVPALAAMLQGKHHPLQWNIGSVQRYIACRGMPHVSRLPTPLRYAPRCEYTTPFGLPVVPDV